MKKRQVYSNSKNLIFLSLLLLFIVMENIEPFDIDLTQPIQKIPHRIISDPYNDEKIKEFQLTSELKVK